MDPGSSVPDGGAGPAETTVTVESGTLRYVRAGAGETTIVLLHGWPQSAYAWRFVMPLLAERFDVIAFDLPSTGGSVPWFSAFDKRTLAGQIRKALAVLGVKRAVMVGHDLGAVVAYAYARRFGEEISGLVVLDQPVPGIPGWDTTAESYPFWHLGFHQDVQNEVGVAETLVSGREAFYFRSFIDRFAAHPQVLTAGDLDAYVAAYGTREKLAAGFAMFRTLPLDVRDNENDSGRLDLPVLLAFAEYSHATLLDTVAEGLREKRASDVRTAYISDCGHWVAEEQPRSVADLIAGLAAEQ